MATTTTRINYLQLVRKAASSWVDDNCQLQAAALCYYTVFALPPLLILLIMLAGVIWNPDSVQRALETQFSGLIGPDGAKAVREMVTSGQYSGHGVVATIFGLIGLIVGTTGAFLSMQEALNAAWSVQPDPALGGVKRFLTRRLWSLGMVVALGFLVVVSLALTAAVGALAQSLGGVKWVIEGTNVVVSTVILSAIFAAIFKFLPDAIVSWRSVAAGGIATAVLFELGKFVIGLYLGRSHPGNAFGAASALAIILVWIYYAGILVLFGAELTQEYARIRGHGVTPKAGAVRVERLTVKQ